MNRSVQNSATEKTQSPPSRPMRWPAEWEPHAATWLTWPKNPETWPDLLDEVVLAYVQIIEALIAGERVCILVDNAEAAESARVAVSQHGVQVDGRIDYHLIETNDAWIRDYGPIGVYSAASGSEERVWLNFGFNAWGGKYPPWQSDAAAGARIASTLQGPLFDVEEILEGGAIDGNGEGLVLTTESCMLNRNRALDGLPRSREAVNASLSEWLGARKVIWLKKGIIGDDTDGHVDDLARFVDPETIVAAIEPNSDDANQLALEENWSRLVASRGLSGRPFNLVKMPMPPPVHYAGARLPASYMNFFVANQVVLIPSFGAATDRRAAAILGECFPGRDIVRIPSRALVVGLGALHCLTQQEPLAFPRVMGAEAT
ncbi:MAG: agmatine deiminase family protein [Myxococcota bacterium]|nr:agmatine deiminase family protein [Myxococcota bacterium]